MGAAIIFTSSNLPSIAQASDTPSVSIKLKNYIGNQTQLNVTVKGQYDVPGYNFSLLEGKTYTVKVENNSLSLYENGTLLGSFSNLSIVPKVYGTDNYIFVNNHPYLGSMNFTTENNAYVRPVNTLPMEDYLKGVVPFEMMASWNKEALKAQAVAARTYTVRNQSNNMDDTTNFQAYGGYLWNNNSTAAVNETNAQTLTYGGKTIDAFYSASDGGITESNANVWGGTPLAFYPIKQDPYDTKVPWGFTIKKTQVDTTSLDLANPQNWWNSVNEADSALMANIKSWMAQNGYANNEIKIISVPSFSFSSDRTTGNRVKYANISLQFFLKDKTTGQFVMDNNQIKVNTLTLANASATKIRAMIGASTMKSYLLANFSEDSTAYTVNGLGNGHGVGMSQWGAKAMADQGLSYKDILSFYFTGTALANAQNTTSPSTTSSPSQTTLPPKGCLDSPTNGGTIKGQVNVSGWSLDGSGVSLVEVLVDGKTVGAAQYGNARPDVLNAYPNYQNANSGYQYTLNTETLSNGQHTLSIRETGKNGTVTVLNSVQVNVANLLPIGFIDNPINGSAIKGNMTVSGWFLDQKGVAKVDVLVDGQNVGTAVYGSSRSDVQNVYPQYQNANSGYQFTLDSNSLADGEHNLTVQETGLDDHITTLNSIKIAIKNGQTLGYIDAPADGAAINRDANISGWFLDGRNVSKIEVLVDGNMMGTAQYGSARPDVLKAFPDFQNANSGYQYALNTRMLKNGQHTLTIRETGMTGTVTNLPNKIVNVQNLPAMGYIDTPADGTEVNGDANISGWFLDGSDVSKVEIFVDGVSMGVASYGNARSDVEKVFPQYQNANAGYQYTLDTKQIVNGQHTLTVAETGTNGSTSTLTSKVTINNQ